MKIIHSITKIRKLIKAAKVKAKTIGFVPTMGYFHAGHISLMRQAKKDCGISIVSIFVNPLQFAPKEDFKKYPRNIKRDERLSKEAKVDIIFYPSAKAMYPSGYRTFVEVDKISDLLCGKFRPGHFKGVATVVTKLFNIVQPDIAYFGQKDIQQAIVIKKLAEDLNIPLKIKLMPTVREKDGLAMSSRNIYLNREQRREAVVFWQSLKKARKLIKNGERRAKVIISLIKKLICTQKYARIDYVECVSFGSLLPVKIIKGKAVIALAVWLGRTRLIDNIIVRV